MTSTDHKQSISDYLTTLGLTYTATFQPAPQPKETVKHPQLHWLITLTRGKQSAQFPYFEGVAHVKGYKQVHKTSYDQRIAEEGYRKTCETGKLYNHFSDTLGWIPRSIGPKVQPNPELADVLYCLVMDSSVLDVSSYEEWASDYGYDTDSRKGEEVYRQCLKQSLAFKNLIGYEALEKLHELFQDY